MRILLPALFWNNTPAERVCRKDTISGVRLAAMKNLETKGLESNRRALLVAGIK
jgi:hypothetical protein